MEMICPVNKCTGCGMCTNVCPKSAISMCLGVHDFLFPKIDSSLCVNCGMCAKVCPSNRENDSDENVKEVYAAWNKDKSIRRYSTSGGIYSVLCLSVLRRGGVVVGVAWNDSFHPYHMIIDNENDLKLIRGSKYSQSITSDIYSRIKELLNTGITVLFSGTPCQNAALKSYLNRDYQNLYLVDVVCHGVPSNRMLDKYYSQFKGNIRDVNFRSKAPYWDYSYVKIEFDNESVYWALTTDDSYFNLFNIGYSLRPSCHECKYASTHRCTDITLADFWGYSAHSFVTRNYNLGTSLVLVNTQKGMQLFDDINEYVFFEKASIDIAKKGNKCLSEPFVIDCEKLNSFWKDYDAGMSINDLNNKYCARTILIPKHITLRRLYHKWKWIVGR